jgi:hypothetical protein
MNNDYERVFWNLSAMTKFIEMELKSKPDFINIENPVFKFKFVQMIPSLKRTPQSSFKSLPNNLNE